MSPNIRTFLRRSYDERDDAAELEKALGCLPAGTTVYEYENVPHMEGTAHALDRDKCEFCVFVNVPKNIQRRLEGKKVRIKRFYPKIRAVIIEIPTEPHEAASRWLTHMIERRLSVMGMDITEELREIGSTTFDGMEADEAYRPWQLPPGRSNWPSLVLEVGKSETHAKLRQDADDWLQNPNGDVRGVITIKVTPKQATIIYTSQRGRGNPIVVKEPRSSQRGRTTQVTGGPLIVPFQDLFLRTPAQGQTDLVFTNADLIEWARAAWASFP